MKLFQKYRTERKLQTIRNSPVLVLAYHNIVNQDRVGDDLYSVTIKNFEKHLFIIKKYFNCISLDSLLAGSQTPKPRVLITFDDGLRNNYTLAFPALKKKGLSALFFISPGFIEQQGFLSWQELKEMQKNGMEIGSHGFLHPDFAKLTQAQAQNELEKSKQALWEKLEIKNPGFAYPYGTTANIKESDKDILMRTGFPCAFLFGGGAFQKISDIYRIPRFFVLDWQKITFFEKVTEAFLASAFA